LYQCGKTTGNAGFVVGKMVHVLPELIHFTPLESAAKAVQRRQRKSWQKSEAIT